MTTSTRERAMALRLEGRSCAEIGRLLGVSRQRASFLVQDLRPVYLEPQVYARLAELAQAHGLSVSAYLALLAASL